MNEKEIGRHLMIINKAAKCCFYVADCLEFYLDNHYFPDISGKEKVFQEYSYCFDVNFNRLFQAYTCDNPCDGSLNWNCKGCPKVKKIYKPIYHLPLEVIKDGISNLRMTGDFLYCLKREVCEGFPILEYVKIGEGYYKIMDVGGYHPHIPVISGAEMEKIGEGEIEVKTSEYNSHLRYIPIWELMESINFLEKYLINLPLEDDDLLSTAIDSEPDPVDAESDECNEVYIEYDPDDYDDIDSGLFRC